MKIGNKELGHKPYIIAEAGVNHGGDLALARRLIQEAAKAGADAIKFQTYTADELVVKGTPKFWKSEGGDIEGNQYDAYQALGGHSEDFYRELQNICFANDIEFLSTPFSIKSANFLNELGMNAFKIASSDLSTLPFLEHIANFNKPMLLSTGAATMEEIREAVDTIKEAGNNQIVLLHCTLCYPTKPQDANLNLIKTLKDIFPDLIIGISDHTLGTVGALMAIDKGAKVVEKHFTVDKTLPDSADHWLSVDPVELKEIVENKGYVPDERYLGSKEKMVFNCEQETRKYDKRSIVLAKPVKKGDLVTEEVLTYKRPGTGIWPKFYKILLGQKFNENLPADTILKWTHVTRT